MNTSPSSSPRPRSTRFSVLIISLIVLLLTLIIAILLYFFAYLPAHQPAEEPPISIAIPGDHPPYNFDYSWSEHSPYIAHALGGIFGDSYTNSYEAFLLNYHLGQRLFEVDLIPADDGTIVVAHDPLPTDGHEPPITADVFLSILTSGKYHRLTFADLVRLMREYPDVYMITDTKYIEPTDVIPEFTAIVETATSIDPSVLDRLVIQIYNQPMLTTIMDLYPWKSVIYTLYNDPTWTPDNVLSFAATSGVKYVTMWDTWVTTEITSLWLPAGLKIAAHTVNDLTEANRLRALGVSNIYTDFLPP